MNNVAIWANGTELAHDAPNAISNITVLTNGTLEAGTPTSALSFNSFEYGICGDDGVRYM
jgi:hypothetical protein